MIVIQIFGGIVRKRRFLGGFCNKVKVPPHVTKSCT